jgi:hypothetical protein
VAERPDEVEGCLACDLLAGRRPLPGGTIAETPHWAVQHCVGPLGVGTLIVKPKRHVVGVAGHIHWVVQPVEASTDPSRRGPHLQAAMFEREEYPDPTEVEAAADLVRAALARGRS